jgi:3-polyprenyl-4-hydroxybenzoate decarboxylase
MGLGEKRYELVAQPSAELHNPIFRRQAVFAPGVVVIEGERWREGDSAAAELAKEAAVQPFRLVCLVDDADDCTRDEASFLWTIFTRFEPAADIYARETRLHRFHVELSSPLVLDCRMKPWYPPPVEPLPETVARVDALWPRIFPRGV